MLHIENVRTGLLKSSFSQTLPIFLDGIVSAWVAIIVSVTLILLFGEVGPFTLKLFKKLI